ncbi:MULTISPECIES: ADP-ribosylglycohydrolase family protein [unclassified Acinetobacter]|uniref:ADP-ribosylglycohydrolase family protein n=1 Tax=unclassified Acinetobacter TaxID=196816 RepID=UPI0035B9E56E
MSKPQTSTRQQQILHCLIGGAIGDAYGLSFENLSKKRVQKFYRGEYYHFIPIINGAMVSDDTEHAVMTLQAYIHSAGDAEKFKKSLKRHLMLWLLTLPAGIGMATGRSLFKMWLGFKHTGMYSAGNGAAMRASILGVLCDDIQQLKQLNHISTTLSHTDPKAEQGALWIALLAWVETRHHDWSQTQVEQFLQQQINDPELLQRLQSYQADHQGITGYMYHSVPAVYQAWQNYRQQPAQGMTHLILQGGDTDSTCAIFGGIVGIHYAPQLKANIQGMWCEPKLNFAYFEKIAQQADRVYQSKISQSAIKFGGITTLLRNLMFLMIVLLHGFRRLLPPY